MRKLLFLSAAILLISPAVAQENVIRVIGEDGSVQEIELKSSTRSAVPRLPKEEPPKIVKPQPLPEPEPILPPVPDMPEIKTEMPEQLKAIVELLPEEEAEPEIEVDVAPADDVLAEPAAVEDAPALEQPQEPDEIIEWQQEERVGGVMIKPGRKPAVPYRYAKPDYSAAKKVTPSGPVTKEQALAIAVEKAPPASGMMAVPRVIDGQPVYVVKFRTENGPLEIVVDQATGAILR